MRSVPPPVQSKLDTQYGTEPLILVEIEWVEGSPVLYSDQKINGADYPHPTILSVGGFDTSMMLSGASDSLQLSLTLDDVDGHLKEIYLNNDVHKRPAKLYLTYKGLNVADRIPLFTGQVVTPFEWSEGKRTLKLTLLSKLEESEVGFSMEEGNFPNIPEEALGQAWPLVFGQVCHIPTVQIRAPRLGTLLEGTGIHDWTLHARLCQAKRISCPLMATGTVDAFLGSSFQKLTSYAPDYECMDRRHNEICKTRDLLEQQVVYETPTLEISNGVSFPQGEVVTIKIDGATFTGTFNGNTYTVASRKHPDYDSWDHKTCRNVSNRRVSTRTSNISAAMPMWGAIPPPGTSSGPAPAGRQSGGSLLPLEFRTNYAPDPNVDTICKEDTKQRVVTNVGGPNQSWKFYEEIDEAGFFWLPAGSEVAMEAEAEVIAAVSLLPGTVDMVSAYRTFPDGRSLLTEVPVEHYTVYETDFEGYTVVEVVLAKSLSLIDDKFDDQIYVSFTSSVGPNMADIIEWLVNKYTTLTVDAASFAAVKAATAKYPCNFFLLGRPSVYQVMQDIAYQSRCSVHIRNDVVYLTYLSEEPTAIRTLSESDILLGSFDESLSDTDDVATSHRVTWRPAGARVNENDDLDFFIRLKYNIKKYGTSVSEWDYYTQNTFDTVLKSATFWLIRKACSWKKLKFALPVKHIDLDVNDAVMLDVAQFSATPIKCVIESSQYDPANNTVKVVCWTPVRAGELSPYYWAWPSQQSATAKWPLPGDDNGGGGYDFQVTPPTGHVLLGGQHREDQLVVTTGDEHPSDLDDTTPTVDCLVSELIDFNQIDPVIEAKKFAGSASRQAMENGMGGGGGGNDDDEEDETEEEEERELECGQAADGLCAYSVIEKFWQSATQGQNNAGVESGCGGPCGSPSGCPSCTGKGWEKCHTFASARAAYLFFTHLSNLAKPLHEHWSANEIARIDPLLGSSSGQKADGSTCDSLYSPGEWGPPDEGDIETGPTIVSPGAPSDG